MLRSLDSLLGLKAVLLSCKLIYIHISSMKEKTSYYIFEQRSIFPPPHPFFQKKQYKTKTILSPITISPQSKTPPWRKVHVHTLSATLITLVFENYDSFLRPKENYVYNSMNFCKCVLYSHGAKQLFVQFW